MTHPQPSPEATRPRKDIGFKEFVILCACLMSMNALSVDPMLPALPAIARDLAIPHPNDRQLIITAYFLGLGVGSLLFGVLSDRYGRKVVLGWSMGFFILSSVACAATHSFAMMLTARASAGFFAGAGRVITVGIVRDRFKADAMARVMSLIFAIFMLVPVIAPSFGQFILWFAPWRWIFWTLAILAALVMAWMLVRLPETLKPEHRLPISPPAIVRSVRTILRTRVAMGYMLASGVVMSALFSFILSIQQIFFDVFDAGASLPVGFAIIAGSMGVGSLLNSRLVSRFGARRLSQGALLVLMAINALHLATILAGRETLSSFILFQAITLMTIAFTSSNFSAISMEPFGKGAGIASSFQAFVTTAISAGLGSIVGYAFNGTTLPLTLGMLAFGAIAFLIVIWGEQGKLFTRPHRDALREPEFETL